ncbi:hypothetical protein SAMD00079811_59230 [Scytonema sp. HK-05]|nr:hypothetical protein NIES2130_33835 [Scytonema sp. HK-05]BAY48302.1 hypothetical protein SAMD00079811_59230 [Scytonema sp. HK-05]
MGAALPQVRQAEPVPVGIPSLRLGTRHLPSPKLGEGIKGWGKSTWNKGLNVIVDTNEQKVRLIKPPCSPPKNRGDGVSRGVKYIAASRRNGISRKCSLSGSATSKAGRACASRHSQPEAGNEAPPLPLTRGGVGGGVNQRGIKG